LPYALPRLYGSGATKRLRAKTVCVANSKAGPQRLKAISFCADYGTAEDRALPKIRITMRTLEALQLPAIFPQSAIAVPYSI